MIQWEVNVETIVRTSKIRKHTKVQDTFEL
jgi:hypothetical protein